MTKRHISYSVLVIQRGLVYSVFLEKSSKNPAMRDFFKILLSVQLFLSHPFQTFFPALY